MGSTWCSRSCRGPRAVVEVDLAGSESDYKRLATTLTAFQHRTRRCKTTVPAMPGAPPSLPAPPPAVEQSDAADVGARVLYAFAALRLNGERRRALRSFSRRREDLELLALPAAACSATQSRPCGPPSRRPRAGTGPGAVTVSAQLAGEMVINVAQAVISGAPFGVHCW